jgi:PKHD-type hydroxylase
MLDQVRERMVKALLANPLFDLAVRPKTLTSLLFSKSGTGQGYGSHVDNAIMRGVRTDVSFTVFLSDPASYDGGELVMQGTAGGMTVKLPAGYVFAYPSTTLHRVETVTRGERLVCAGWAQSFIRDADKRQLLYDLETAQRTLFDRHGKTAEFDLLSKSTTNLIRMWAAD